MKVASELNKVRSQGLFVFNTDSSEGHSGTIAVLQPTQKCNLECISCPQPIEERSEPDPDNKTLITDLLSLPLNLRHLTISGGEPTLRFNLLLSALEVLRDRVKPFSIQLLTNAVKLSHKELCARLKDVSPRSFIIGIPLYTGHADLHDSITRKDGSFSSTMRASELPRGKPRGFQADRFYFRSKLRGIRPRAIKNLTENGMRVEIRVIVSRLTASELPATATFIAKNLGMVERVLLIAPEIHGSARANLTQVWQDPREQWQNLMQSSRILINCGISVSLFNYTLCMIPESLWSISTDSISPWKKAYSKCCDECSVRPYCAGYFACNKDLMDTIVCPVIQNNRN